MHVSRVNNFSECHENITKHTNRLQVGTLIRNKFLAILQASGRILNKECEKISFLHDVKKKFNTSWVHGDIIGTLSLSGCTCCGTRPEHEAQKSFLGRYLDADQTSDSWDKRCGVIAEAVLNSAITRC
jgi:hypothetical protein